MVMKSNRCDVLSPYLLESLNRKEICGYSTDGFVILSGKSLNQELLNNYITKFGKKL
jgi:hypothetical protein